MRRLLVIVLILVLVGSVLSGSCGPKAAPSPAPAPASVTPEGELRLALSTMGNEALDPIASATINKWFQDLMFDPLIGVTRDTRQYDPTGGVASKWETSPDGLVMTLYLRKGIRFHNGDELTAEDVKFSIERGLGPRSLITAIDTVKKIIKEVKVVDPYKMEIHFNKPTIVIPYYLSSLYAQLGYVTPKKYIEEVGEKQFAIKPVGSGPYKFVEQVAGSYIKLEAVDKHWHIGVPKYKTVTFTFAPEEATRIALLKTGQADVVDISRGRAAELKKAGFNIFGSEGGSIVGMIIAEQYKAGNPTSDIRVREALNLAVNRKQIAETILSGQATPTSFYPSGSQSLGYKPLPPYPYDPERARQLLKEAGYPRGFEITIRSYPSTGLSEWAEVGEAVGGFLEAIGVRAKIVTSDWGAVRTAYTNKTLGTSLVITNTSDIRLGASQIDTFFRRGGLLASVDDPVITEMLDKALGAPDEARYAEATGSAMKYIHDNFLTIPLAENNAVRATSKNITQWEVNVGYYGMNTLDLVWRR